MKQVYWAGGTPRCDMGNGHKLNGGFSDARLPSYGQWALLCPACAKQHNVMYGTGRGQRYEEQSDGRWFKVEG